jgi:tetratricopeptide (TPR) repeat protein
VGFRFWRRIRIAPGVTLNLSKSILQGKLSVSVGPRAAKATFGPHGLRATGGLTGTGLFYTVKKRRGKKKRAGAGERTCAPDSATSPSLPPEPTTASESEQQEIREHFDDLSAPPEEAALVNGLRELALGNREAARHDLERAAGMADGAYVAGALALEEGRWEDAVALLARALEGESNLGFHLGKYGLDAALEIGVTEEVSALIRPCRRGVLLALAEAYQELDRMDEAIEALEDLRAESPEDVIIRLSIADLLLDAEEPSRVNLRRAVELGEGVENESSAHGNLLLFKARALRLLGMPDPARRLLSLVLRRKKDRPPELLLALRYERALCSEALGKPRELRADLEHIFSECSGYEDVAERLELD